MRPPADTRGRSLATKLLLWGVALIVGLVLLRIAVSIALGIVYAVLTTLLTLAVLAGIVYLAARLWLGSGSSPPTGRTDGGVLDAIPGRNSETGADRREDPIDRLQDQYLAGEIDEAEYERRLELYLDSPDGGTGERSRSRTRERNRGR